MLSSAWLLLEDDLVSHFSEKKMVIRLILLNFPSCLSKLVSLYPSYSNLFSSSLMGRYPLYCLRWSPLYLCRGSQLKENTLSTHSYSQSLQVYLNQSLVLSYVEVSSIFQKKEKNTDLYRLTLDYQLLSFFILPSWKKSLPTSSTSLSSIHCPSHSNLFPSFPWPSSHCSHQ